MQQATLFKNWKIATPDPTVTFGHKCEPYPVEMIVRAYSYRQLVANLLKPEQERYAEIKIPDGMKEHQRFDKP